MPDPGVHGIGGTPTLRRQIQAALGGNKTVTSATYIGKDAVGRPMYRIQYVVTPGPGFRPGAYGGGGTPSRPRVNTTITWHGGKIGKPNLDRGNDRPPSGAGAAGAAGALKKRQDYWLTRLYGLHDSEISSNNRQQFVRMVSNWTRSVGELNRTMNLVFVNLPHGSTAVQEPVSEEDFFGDFDFGSGSLGGAVEPVYRAPDRRVVEDMVRGMMQSLVGTVLQAELDSIVDLYMADHKRNWESEAQEIDPSQSALEAIRRTNSYRAIHQRRPEGEDERNWVSDRRRAAEAGGLNVGAQEEFAIEQATIGGDLGDVQDAAAVEQLQDSGTLKGTSLEDRLRNMTTTFFSGVR